MSTGISSALPSLPLPALSRWQCIQRALLASASGVLLVDSVLLIAWRHFNMGVVVPGVLGAFGAVMAWYWPQLQQWRGSSTRHARWWAAGWSLFAVWLLSVGVFWNYMLNTGVAPDQVPPVQAIVVLGSGTQDGHPRPVLAARLDTAAELAQLQPQALIAVCGGVDWGETESEAVVMARYLQQRHDIAPQRLVLESESTSTELNLLLSRPLLQARGIDANAPTAVVSSDFHLLRAIKIARQQGLSQAIAVAAPMPLTTRYNAWLREYFASLSSWALGEV